MESRPRPPEHIVRALEWYAQGAFPMDDAGAADLPWYTAPHRATFPLTAEFRDALRRRLRRDVRRCEDHRLEVDGDYSSVLRLCATPPEGEGVWITPRLAALYRGLNQAGFAHSFELRRDGGELSAGILGITLGRAAMLESMRRIESGAGNALLIRTLDHLASRGFELCDIQLPTAHTERLGCVMIPHEDYVHRLRHALRA